MTTMPPAVTCVVPYAKCYEQQVLALARELCAESVFHGKFPLDEAKLLQQIEAAATAPGYHFRLCVRNGVVLGGFIGLISSAFFTQDKVAKDLTWFVTKSHRGSRAAVMLLRDFEAWGTAQGVKHFMLGQATGVKQETTQALYEHLGYRVVGVNTVKHV